MADKKQPFRFRLPWLAPERPAQPQRRRPTTETPQVPRRPTVAVLPSQQSAARTPRVAPSQPPRQQPQLPPKGDSQSPSPSSSPGATQNPKTLLYSAISEPPSTSSTTTKSSPSSQAAPETIKATSKPTSSPTSITITKPPSQSTSSPSGSTTKTSSPSRATTESLNSTSQSTSPPSSEQPRAATESSKSRAAIESPKSTISSSSKQPPTTSVTAKMASPSRAASESPKATSKSVSTQPSPSRATNEPRTSSQPASPSTQARTQIRTTSIVSSPSKGDSKSKTSSTPPPPSRSNSQDQPEARKTSQPQSPSRLEPQKITPSKGSPSRKDTQKEPETTASNVLQSPSSATAQPSNAQEEPKKETSQEPLQVLEPKVVLTSGTTKSLTLQDDSITKERAEVSSSEKSMPAYKEVVAEPKKPQIVDSEVGRDDQKPMVGESKEIEEMKERVQELPKEEKNWQATTYEEPVQKAIVKMPGFEKDGRDVHVGEFQASKRQQKRETSARKGTFATTSYIGKQIKTIEGTSMSFQNLVEEATARQREIKEDISKLVRKLATGTQLDENQVTVITLTGENKGASMLLSSEQVKKEAPIHIHRGYKTDPDDTPPDTTTDEEVCDNRKKLDSQMAPEPKAYVNSNAQGVNNSIVIEASLAERNPGVHLFLSQNTTKAIKANGASEFIQTHRAECSTTTSDRLTHEPTVRRRCLRGLFMESSDSDLDNPNKSRRHGCRYSCRKNKDKEFM